MFSPDHFLLCDNPVTTVFQQIIHVIILYMTKATDLWSLSLKCQWSIFKELARSSRTVSASDALV